MKKILFLIVILITRNVIAISQDSCGIQWQDAVQISPDNAAAYTPRMAAQGDSIHLTYYSEGVYRLPYARSTDAGQTWTIKEILTDSVLFPYPPNDNYILANSHYVFILSTVPTPIGYLVSMFRSTDFGSTWDSIKELTNNNSAIRDVAIKGDTITIFYMRGDTIGYERTLSSTDAGNTWTTTQSVSFDPYHPKIAISNNYLHLVYQYAFEIYYRRSTDLGITWSSPIALSTIDGYGSQDPAITADNNGNLYVAYRETKYRACATGFSCDIAFRRSTTEGSSWMEEQKITENPWGFNVGLSINDTQLLASWGTDTPSPGVESRISFDKGNTWCPVTPLTSLQYYAVGPSNILAKSTVVVGWHQLDTIEDKFHIVVRAGKLPIVSVEETELQMPEEFFIEPVFPNPFNSSTTIHYYLPNSEIVRIAIYDIQGKVVDNLLKQQQTIGWHTAVWDANNVNSGIYFIRFGIGNKIVVKKVVLLK